MPEVHFAQALQTHVPCQAQRVAATTVRAALDAAFAAAPRLRAYVLDEHGALRHHVAVFVDGKALADRTLATPVAEHSRIHVIQALSGG
ncbi:MAG: MoaD/ThiS family protein [Planctomycetes bacterium]|nr:MoaD/ThiS family protein [Planctomycetota bacterium]